MKKIISLSLVLCFGFSLFAFSPSPTKTKNYSDITDSQESFNLKEVASFQEAEESATTADKGTWSKRYRVWTDFAKSADLNEIENAINKH
jgi:hypothetical protein